MKQKILFIINPISGTVSKAGIPEAINDYLDKDKFDYYIAETSRPGQATELAADAARDHFAVVVAIGGDGTVNEVGRALTHTDTAMAIIPCGSGNGLARHLLIPLNVKRSIEIINACEIHDLDYGVINDHKFFCTCGMGFDAFISFKFAEAGKRGPITYVQQILEKGLSYKPETYELETEEESKRYKAFLISIANASQYGNNAYIAPRATMQDGLVDVTVMHPFNMVQTPLIGARLFLRQLSHDHHVSIYRGQRVTIERSHDDIMHIDGDPVMMPARVVVENISHGIPILVTPSLPDDV